MRCVHPAVEEVAIVGFAHERWGEAPHAFVVLKEGTRADERERASLRGRTSRTSKRHAA
jgi:acyl-coenzyme A synthetase/AMP-(fatty) acid ligase